MLSIKHFFTSFDGEISPFHQGKLTLFIRTSGCNFESFGGCTWCDSKESQKKSKTDRIIVSNITLKQFFNTHIKNSGLEKITITGGEPLLQEEGVNLLSTLALENGMYVTIETNGSIIPKFPIAHPKFGYVVDYKLPSSGMESKMNMELPLLLTKNDVWKFVIGTYTDYKRARKIVREMGDKVEALIAFQPVFGIIHPKLLLEWMIRDKLYKPIISVQIHKVYGVE